MKLKSGFTEIKNYSRQIPAPFKIHAEKYHDHIPCSFAYKLVCVDNTSSKPVVLYRGENVAYNFIKMMFEKSDYCKKVMKKYFKKNLIMT